MFEYYLLLLFIIFYVLRGLLMFSSRHKHLLITLLRLEYVILNIFFLLIFNIIWDRREAYLALIFLVFAVSEGRLGLSLLVSIVRSHGGDYFKRFNLVW